MRLVITPRGKLIDRPAMIFVKTKSKGLTTMAKALEEYFVSQNKLSWQTR